MLDEDHDGVICSSELIEVLTEVRLNRKTQVIY